MNPLKCPRGLVGNLWIVGKGKWRATCKSVKCQNQWTIDEKKEENNA